MVYYFDDVEVARYWQPDPIAQAQDMYLIINLAVGGWAPDPYPAEYPAVLQCDWVHVYQSAAPVVNGSYQFVNQKSGKLLDVESGSIANGGNVIQYQARNSASQWWTVTPVDADWCQITNRASKRSLDVWNWNGADGGDIRQYDSTGGDNQLFRFEAVGGGYYRLINKFSGKAVVVLNGAVNNGADVIQWTWNGSDDQRWLLVPPAPVLKASGVAGGTRLLWDANPGLTYRVQWKTALAEAAWSDLPGEVVASAATATKTDTSATTTRFYRVAVVP